MKYNKSSLISFGILVFFIIFILSLFFGYLDEFPKAFNDYLLGVIFLYSLFLVPPIVCLVFGGISLRQIRISREKGKILSIISIILSLLYFVLTFLIITSSLSELCGPTARCKGVDSAIKGILTNSKSQASSFFDKNKTYIGVCTSEDGISDRVSSAIRLLNKKAKVGGNTQDFVHDPKGEALGSAVCHDSKDAWVAMVSLKGTKTGWCVDSTGAYGESATLSSNAMTCSEFTHLTQTVAPIPINTNDVIETGIKSVPPGKPFVLVTTLDPSTEERDSVLLGTLKVTKNSIYYSGGNKAGKLHAIIYFEERGDKFFFDFSKIGESVKFHEYRITFLNINLMDSETYPYTYRDEVELKVDASPGTTKISEEEAIQIAKNIADQEQFPIQGVFIHRELMNDVWHIWIQVGSRTLNIKIDNDTGKIIEKVISPTLGY